MNILIANCHTANRGDEAAVKALIDRLCIMYPNIDITLGMRGPTRYPNLPQNVKSVDQIVALSQFQYKFFIAKITKGKLTLGKTYKKFIDEIKKADLIIHAPGGPSIGDTYYEAEKSYLNFYDLLISMNKPYMFYAPSMGPFNKEEHNKLRKKVLENAEAIVVRDPISAGYVRNFVPEKKVYQTLDSAFQYDVNIEQNFEKFNELGALSTFMKTNPKCIGITITELDWHPVYSLNNEMGNKIKKTFQSFIQYLIDKGFGIIFIPQLYGTGNDFDLMNSYCTDNEKFYVLPDNNEKYDAYFQQYLIGQLYAVVGMRYHSNIFSAKMATPFISVAYEQKMSGFMKKIELEEYLISLDMLSIEVLIEKFNRLEKEYSKYKKHLEEIHDYMKNEAYKTTEIVNNIMNSSL